MITLCLMAVFLSASLSLLSYVYCWHDIKGGRPHIISLRQITSVMDRAMLTELFGPPEPGYYYALSPQQIYDIIATRRWFYVGECIADTLCLLGVWAYMTAALGHGTVYWFIALGGLCQGINVAYSIRLISKWGYQIREEIENSED